MTVMLFCSVLKQSIRTSSATKSLLRSVYCNNNNNNDNNDNNDDDDDDE